MPPSLIALAGPMHGDVVSLPDSGLTVGRDAANDLHPGDVSLSRRHCAFTVENGLVTVSDLDSMNGTFVNGVPVKTRVLQHGDHMKIGESVFLFLQKEAAAATAAAVFDGPAHEPTVKLAKEEVLQLQSGRMIEALPAELRQGRTLEGVLRVAVSLASAQTADAVRQVLSDGLFELVPAGDTAIVWSEDGHADAASAYTRSRRGDAAAAIS